MHVHFELVTVCYHVTTYYDIVLVLCVLVCSILNVRNKILCCVTLLTLYVHLLMTAQK